MNENIEKYLLLIKERKKLEKIQITDYEPSIFNYKKTIVFFVVFFFLMPISFYFFGFEFSLFPISTSFLFLASCLYSGYNFMYITQNLYQPNSFVSVFFEKGIKIILPVIYLLLFHFSEIVLQDNFISPLFHYFIVISCFLFSFFILNCIPFLFFKYTKFKSQNEIIEKLSIVEKEIQTTEELLINDKESFSFILNDKTDKFTTLKNNEKFKQVFFDILKEEKKLNDFSMENE
ncbi:MAG: hypothetical protein CL760_10175 [Chloroflexi bacterium]|nr:hypothetical protein [Chloroflexota bacterium]